MKDRLLLIDAESLMFRAYYGLSQYKPQVHQGDLADRFAGTVARLIKEKEASYAAVAFDMPMPRMPIALKVHIPDIKDKLKTIGIACFEVSGYEAADILATIAKKLEKENLEIFFVTSSKPALQLAGTLKVLNPYEGNVVYDSQTIERKYLVKPNKIAHLLAICGDEAEKIDGVPGVGLKRAASLLNKYGSIEKIFSHADEIEGKSLEALKTSKDLVKANLKKAKINTTVPIEVALADLEIKVKHGGQVAEEKNYRTILSTDDFDLLLNELNAADEFAFDTETTGIDPLRAELVGISFSVGGKPAYIPLAHEYKGALCLASEAVKAQLDREYVVEKLKPIFEDALKKKIAQNAKYDMLIIKRYGIDVKGLSFDTMLGSFVLNPVRGGHTLDELAEEYLNFKMTPFKELIGTLSTMKEVDIEKASKYACEDADATFRLKGIFYEKLKAQSLLEFLEEVEMPLVSVTMDMEMQGVRLNRDRLELFYEGLDEKLKDTEEAAYAIAGVKFDLLSHQKIAEVLFEHLKLPMHGVTKKAHASTRRYVLNVLSKDHPIAGHVLKYQALSRYKDILEGFMKLHGSWSGIPPVPQGGTGCGIKKRFSTQTERLHLSFNQFSIGESRETEVSRALSSDEPLVCEFKKCFIADDGSSFISLKYRNLLFYILSGLSGDKKLIGDLSTGADPLNEISKKSSLEPDMAKAIFWGGLLREGDVKLREQVGISQKELERHIKETLSTYPQASAFCEDALLKGIKDGFVANLSGRMRMLPELKSQNRANRALAEKEALRFILLSSKSDIIKRNLIRVYDLLNNKFQRSRIAFILEDTFVLECGLDECDMVMDEAVPNADIEIKKGSDFAEVL